MASFNDFKQYVDKGWSVIPLDSRTRKPIIKWKKYQYRPPKDAEIESWIRRHKNLMVGLVTGLVSGVSVIDVDYRKNPDVESVPKSDYVVKTPGGEHRYYRVAEQVPNSVGADGIDVRGDGGFVIAPPSVRGDGGVYSVLTDGEPAEWPTAFIAARAKITEKAPTGVTDAEPVKQDWLAEAFRSGPAPGTSNDVLTKVTGYLVSKQVPSDVIEAIMRGWVQKWRPDKPEAEVSATLKSVLDRRAEEKSEDFRVLSYKDFRAKYSAPVEWIVPKLVPRQCVGIVAAPPESYKSWLMYDLCVSIATGTAFLGHFELSPNLNRGVLIVQQEDALNATRSRIDAIATARGIDPDSLELMMHDERKLEFSNKGITEKFADFIREHRPELVLLDPLWSMASTDNHMAAVPQQIKILKDLRDQCGTTFIFVHHRTKGKGFTFDRESSWGSQLLNASIEFGFQISKISKSEIVIGMHTKVDEAHPPVKVTFSITGETNEKTYATKSQILTEEDIEMIAAEMEAQVMGKRKQPGAPQGPTFEEAPDTVIEAEIVELIRGLSGATRTEVKNKLSNRKPTKIRELLDQLEGRGAIISKSRKYFVDEWKISD